MWQVSGEHIAQSDPPTSALQTAEVAPGQRALVLPSTASPADPAGTLVFEESSRRIAVKGSANGSEMGPVDAIAVIPPSP